MRIFDGKGYRDATKEEEELNDKFNSEINNELSVLERLDKLEKALYEQDSIIKGVLESVRKLSLH